MGLWGSEKNDHETNIVLFPTFLDRDQFQLGSLSHLIDNKASGYQELPEWPEEAPDSSVRDVEVQMPWVETKGRDKKKPDKKKSFYSEDESSSEGNFLHSFTKK